jgi:hypothetical protein
LNAGNWEYVAATRAAQWINVASHGFSELDALYMTGANTYAKAKADIDATSEVIGIVAGVTTNYFMLISEGNLVRTSGTWTAAATYFLSDSVAGGSTATEPTVIGRISKPLFVAKNTTEAFVNIMRGSVVGGTNALSQITLANNIATPVQDVSAWDAGELTGFVFIDATTDLRFHIKMQFARVGAGGNYNIAYQTMGDTPPVNFAVAISAGGVISITLPTIAGFVSSYIQYSINGPAVGATFPLSISASNVLGRTDGVAVPAGYIGEVIPFTLRTVTGTAASWASNTTALATLTPGVWSIRGRFEVNFNNAASSVAGAVATTSTADSTGRVAQATLSYAQVTTAIVVTLNHMAELQLLTVASNTPLYAKFYCEDASINADILGFAIRIA